MVTPMLQSKVYHHCKQGCHWSVHFVHVTLSYVVKLEVFTVCAADKIAGESE